MPHPQRVSATTSPSARAIGRPRPVLLALALVLALAQTAAAQVAVAAGPSGDTIEGRLTGVPTSVAIGVQAGLPGYRVASLVGSVRAGGFGVAARLGYGTVGVSGGAQLRLYAPLPGFVPVYVAGGLDVYAGNTAWHAAAGVHVPLGGRLRIDLEGGAARTSTLLGPLWAPYASLGVSYAFTVDPDAATSGGAAARAEPGDARRCDAQPDADAIPAGVDAAVRGFIADAAALYGTSYRDLTYRYQIVDTQVTGARARVSIAYEGSVREVLTGRTLDASGSAVGELRWDGCAWQTVSVSY
jgi:hypothetical protein